MHRLTNLAARPKPYPLCYNTPSAAQLRPLIPQRTLKVAPAYLLDDYTPRHALLTPTAAAKKRSAAYAHLKNCNLCPRLCSVNRFERAGACLIGSDVKVNTIAPHFGEEPCIQGHSGSGSVFFSGCNLRCVFCQNHDIAHQRNGFDLTPEELGEWFMKLQETGGVHNINLVTPEHVVPQVVLAILAARDMGLNLPIIYNTSSFDSIESLELMDGLVDIYLPDFKVWNPETSKRLLKADDYASTARESLKKMWEQVGDLSFTSDGLAKKGVLLRHLVMPGLEAEGEEIMRFIASVSPDMCVHVMEQYRPDAHVGKGRRRTGKSAPPLQETRVVEPGGEPADAKTVQNEVRYKDINRVATDKEISSVKQAAVDAGLWRFIEPAEHALFHT